MEIKDLYTSITDHHNVVTMSDLVTLDNPEELPLRIISSLPFITYPFYRLCVLRQSCNIASARKAYRSYRPRAL